ncbi:hypothetical protein I4F81_003623 [Pyropia yezoensis]|uniref:Uncharacterized protein n=1 Tax=Pyropia yezoensis TaxID=2788 RepID=A0ACC3BTK4_PYRYE|nr:hypothetical protein I4F81_003623 [Neopyropia yezoensis]
MLRSLSSPLFGALTGDSPQRLPSGGSSGVSSGVDSGADSGSEAGSGRGRSDGGSVGGRSPFSSSLSFDGEDDYVFLGDEILLTFDRLEMFADLKDIVSKERARLSATIRDRTTGLLSATRHRRKETAQLASRLLPDEASRARLQAKLAARRAELLASLREPAIVSFGEKVAFMLGLTLLLVTEGVLLRSPTRMWVWYAGLIGPLLAARAVLYRASKAGFFLYDFCYAAQLLLLGHLFLFPASGPLFRVNFAVANGPLAWAVVLWRNSLVFHSLDRLTSLAVHFLPPLVTFCLRWYGDGRVGGAEAGGGWHYGAAGDGEWRDHAMYAIGLPLGIYAAWQAAYLVKTEVISRNKLERDPELMTSLRWLTRHPGSLFYRAINAFGPTHHVATFVLLQGIYTLLTLSASVLWYESKVAHAAFLGGLFAVAAFNGASFYFEVVRPPPGGEDGDDAGREKKGKGRHRSRNKRVGAMIGGGGGGRKHRSNHHHRSE